MRGPISSLIHVGCISGLVRTVIGQLLRTSVARQVEVALFMQQRTH